MRPPLREEPPRPTGAPRCGPGRSAACWPAAGHPSAPEARGRVPPPGSPEGCSATPSRSSPSSRWGGKILNVGVTRRSTSAKTRSSVSFQARWTRQAAATVSSSKEPPSSRRARTPSPMPSGSSATSEASETQASTTRRSPACKVASSHPGSARSRQSHPTSAEGPVERRGDGRVRVDGQPADDQISRIHPGNAEARLEQLHPRDQSPDRAGHRPDGVEAGRQRPHTLRAGCGPTSS